MRKQKLYFDRYYDQWRGLDIAIEEEINGEGKISGYGLYIQVPDVDMVDDGTINVIGALFEGIEEVVNGEIYDAEKRIIRIGMPPQILANNGLYRVTFTMSIKKNEETIVKNTAVQTFTILEAIEVSNEYIENYDKYSLLSEILKNATDEEIDTSVFAKKEYVNKLIEEALNDVDLDNIIAELEDKDIYITKNELNIILSDYLKKYDTSQFAKSSDLNAYAKTTWVNGQLSYYATNEKLKNYVLKETGKTLTSNDFTDALKEKLTNIPDDGSDYDDTELRELIDKKVSIETFNEMLKGTVNPKDYYDKTSIDKMVNDMVSNINNTHEEDISNIEEELPTFLKKEDYQYADGINTDDVNFNEKTLTEILNELSYKEIEIKSFNSTLISHLYEFNVGRVNSITLKWELNRNPISQTISNYNGTLTVNDREITINNPITSNTDFILKVVDEKGVEKSATVSLKFVFPSYYGVYEDTLDVDSARRGNKIIIDNKNTTIDMSYNNKKVFFASPYEVMDIKDNNGLSYFNDFIHDEFYMNGTLYNVYKLDDKATVKNISYSLIFKKEEE